MQLTPREVKKAIEAAEQLGRDEVYLFEADGEVFATAPNPAICLADDRHPTYPTKGFYIKVQLLTNISNRQLMIPKSVTLTKDGQRVNIGWV